MALTRYPTVPGAGSATYWVQPVAQTGGNAKGTYVELTPATSEALRGVFVMVPNSNQVGRFLVDIATGPAASETVVIANIPFGSPDAGCPLASVGIFIPITIATGTRIATRIQASNTGAGNTVDLAVLAVGGTSSAVPTTYGANTANSQGTTIDPGATANTKGTYTQISASTSAAIDWLIVLLSWSNNAPQNASFALDIATGAAASEVILVPDLGFETQSSFDAIGPIAFSVPVSITAGTRVAARAQSTTNDATDRLVDIVLIGVTNSGLNGASSGAASSYAFIG